MNPIIKKQLSQVRAKIQYDDDTTEIFIPRAKEIFAEIGQTYLINLDPGLTNPTDQAMFAANWNKGKVPHCLQYYAEILDIKGNIYKVNASSTDGTDSFVGWLPFDQVEVVEKC